MHGVLSRIVCWQPSECCDSVKCAISNNTLRACEDLWSSSVLKGLQTPLSSEWRALRPSCNVCCTWRRRAASSQVHLQHGASHVPLHLHWLHVSTLSKCTAGLSERRRSSCGCLICLQMQVSAGSAALSSARSLQWRLQRRLSADSQVRSIVLHKSVAACRSCMRSIMPLYESCLATKTLQCRAGWGPMAAHCRQTVPQPQAAARQGRYPLSRRLQAKEERHIISPTCCAHD
jgi:hypothetical protein